MHTFFISIIFIVLNVLVAIFLFIRQRRFSMNELRWIIIVLSSLIGGAIGIFAGGFIRISEPIVQLAVDFLFVTTGSSILVKICWALFSQRNSE